MIFYCDFISLIFSWLSQSFNNIISGIISSSLVLYLFTRLKPCIYISDKIAKRKIKSGTHLYKIKIINRSSYSAINIQAELSIVNEIFPNQDGDKETNDLEPVNLKKKEIFQLDKYSRRTDYTPYTFSFVISKDELDKYLEDSQNKYLRFRVFAIHSLSNIGKVFEKKYEVSSIIEGDFSPGDLFAIK
jgi:hypothetical protein